MKQDLKILHVIDSLGLGGAQTVVKGIFEAQQNQVNIFLYSLRKRGNHTYIKHKNVFEYKSFSKFSLIPLKSITEMISKENIDVLHCHLFRSNIFGFIVKFLWFPKIKLIFHEHGQILANDFLYCFFLRTTQRWVDKYVAVSNEAADKLVMNAGIHKSKISILHNFVDLDKFNTDIVKQHRWNERGVLGIHEDEYVIGFAGRITYQKGYEDFADMIGVLNAQSGSRFKFLIAGTGAELVRLNDMIRSYDNVVVLGFVSDMEKFYAKLDLFCNPSHIESMGLTQLEAQASGIPVVAANIPGLREVVNDNRDVLLFEKRNSKDLSEKIMKIFSDTKIRDNLVCGGLENAQKYSLSSYIQKLDSIYGFDQ